MLNLLFFWCPQCDPNILHHPHLCVHHLLLLILSWSLASHITPIDIVDILNVLTSFWHPLLPLLLCLLTFLFFVNIHSVSRPYFWHNIIFSIAWTRWKHPLNSHAVDLDHNFFWNFKCCKNNILVIHICHQFISFNTSCYQWQPTYPNVSH